MALFEVWSEGYAATGESSPAQFHGKYEAETFKEAVYKYVETLSPKSKECFTDNEYGLRFWGCRFYDNEKDARKFCG